MLFTYAINENDLGERLDKVLARVFNKISRSELQRCIKSGLVTIDDLAVTDVAKKIQWTGQIVLNYDNSQLQAYDLTPEIIPIDILYEDAYILVINKQAGLVCHPAPGHKSGTLVNALVGRWQLSDLGERPGIVHRLDKDTSGVVLIAKNNIAHAKFADLFANHKGSEIRRFYTCFVFGVPNLKSGKIDTMITRHPKNRQIFTTSKNQGKKAVTIYKVLQTHYFTSTKSISKIECELLTGRTHQIRVHMQYMGCPLIGDPIYGKRHIDSVYPELVKNFNRQALHSSRIMFHHPFFNQKMEFTAPMPRDMSDLEALFSNN